MLEIGVVKWGLELWDRAGSQGLDTWYDPRASGAEGQRPDADTRNATDVEPEGA